MTSSQDPTGSLHRHYNPSPLIDSAGGRGLALYRLLAGCYAAVLVGLHREHVIMWWPILVYFVVLFAWSVAAPLLPRPTKAAIVMELVIAVGGIFLTSIVYEPAEVSAGISTVPGVWAGASVIAAALLAGIRGGIIAALVLSAANLIQTQDPSQLTYHNIILLILLGVLVGLAVQLARESQVRLEEALMVSERLAERDRIGRQVHDGVLQTLALIHRRGREMGDEGRALADLAADQERSLRTLISRITPLPTRAGTGQAAEEVDLAAGLAALRSARVDVVLPPGPVLLPLTVAHEVTAAVEAALDNVDKHAGEGARAWVLLDSDADGVEIVIRDDGAGIAAHRLVEAAAQGRMGASSSIRGRMHDLGGEAAWRAPAAGGTTVTLTLPLQAMAGSRT